MGTPKLDELALIYQTYVETITASELRRQQTTAVFLALIGAALASIGALSTLPAIVSIVAALILSLLWRQKIQFFQNLAKAKWAVVFELEELLPTKPFQREYELLKESGSNGVFAPKRLSDIEKLVPTIVIIFCVCFLIREFLLGSCVWLSLDFPFCSAQP